MPRAVPGREEEDHRQLWQGHDEAGEARSPVDPELDRQRAEIHARIPLYRLEVVEGHDAVGTHRIEEGHRENAVVGQGAGHHGGTCEPGQALVAEPYCRVTPPAVLLQPQGRRAVDPGEDETEQRGAEDPDPERGRDGQGEGGPGQRDVEAPAAGHPAGRDRAQRLVDRIHMAVVPIVDRLRGRADQGAGEHDPGEDQRPAPLGRHTR